MRLFFALYVRHHSYDYNGNRVSKGLPNPFVDSLTHDSIIVQIPRLHGQINNRLDKVLSIFDQSRKDESNGQVINLDDTLYSGDADMQHILHRLLMAATDADMRQDMNVEDEYFSVIEKRDTEIMMRDKKLAEQNVKLAEQNVKLAEQDVKLAEQNVKLAEQKAQLEQKDEMLKSSVQMLVKSGVPFGSIANTLGISIDEVKRLVEKTVQ